MEDNFSRARLEGIIRKKYIEKCKKNNTKKDFIYKYYENDNEDYLKNLKIATFKFTQAHSGIVCYDYNQENILRTISEEEINKTFELIKSNSSANFKYFYESYRRKIDKEYSQEFRDNALMDLKTAYQTYRKIQNPSWNLEASQITENEMENLYNILSKTKPVNSDNIERDK